VEKKKMSGGWSRFRDAQKTAKQHSGPSYDVKDWDKYRFRMDPGQDVDTFVCDPGEHGFPYRTKHFSKGMPRVCTCDIPMFEGKCNYCFYNDKDPDKSYGSGGMTLVELIDFRFFHHTIDTSGKKPRLVYQRCIFDEVKVDASATGRGRGRSCKYCESTDPKVKQRHFGGRRIFELGAKALDLLVATNLSLSWRCLHRNAEGAFCGETIYPIGFSCPACKQTVVDEVTLKGLDDDEYLAYQSKSQPCPHCNAAVRRSTSPQGRAPS
jgi:hypothetical protein